MRTLFSLLAVLSLACQSTVQPRPARVAPPGRVSWSAHLPVVRVAPAQLDGRVGDGRAVTVDAIGTGVADGTAVWVPPLWVEGELRYGLFAPCEVGGLLSPLRAGVELRCQLVQGPLDAAVSAAGAWLWAFGRNAPWGRAGFELSRTGAARTGMLGVFASVGPEAWWFEFVDPPAGLNDPVDPGVTDGPTPGVRAVRDEVALAVPLGLSWAVDDAWVSGLGLGLVLRQVLWAGAPRFQACQGCSLDGAAVRLGPSALFTLSVYGR